MNNLLPKVAALAMAVAMLYGMQKTPVRADAPQHVVITVKHEYPPKSVAEVVERVKEVTATKVAKAKKRHKRKARKAKAAPAPATACCPCSC